MGGKIQMAMGIGSILTESTIRISDKNPGLAALVATLALLPTFLLDSAGAYHYYLVPARLRLAIPEDLRILGALHGAGPESQVLKELLPVVTADFGDLAVVFVTATALVFLATVAEWILVVHSAHATRLGKKPSTKELMMTIGKTRRGAMITVLLVTLLSFALVGALAAMLALLVLVLGDQHQLLLALGVGTVSIAAGFSIAYAGLVCGLARVASVLEDGCDGFAAVERAMDALRELRKLHGLGLSLVLPGFTASASILNWFLVAAAVLRAEGAAWVVALGVAGAGLKGLSAVISMVGYTVLYEEYCSRSHGRLKLAVEMENSI